MSDFWDYMNNEINYQNNLTYTENGAVAFKSTNSKLLDAFSSLGAMRNFDDDSIISTFEAAFNENRELAMRLLFYMRDIRGGQGQRRVFRTILKWLGDNYTDYVIKNLDNILFFGRGDDYLCLLHTSAAEEVYEYLKQKISQDTLNMYANKEVSLLAKWLPSVNTSSKETREYANSIIRVWRWTPKRYRKVLSALRKYINVVEVKMSSKDWNHIEFETVPAKASMIYSDAFYRHEKEKYTRFIESIAEGGKINASSLFPVDIIHKVYSLMYNRNSIEKDRILLNAMWKALPDYLAGKTETGICVIDTSGSMSGTPIEVALSLGIYCADKCRGPFKNKFITFSNTPKLVELSGSDIYEKVKNVKPIVENTNIEAVFDLILKTAVNNKMKQEDLPSKLYIISDMQFDAAQGSLYGWYGREPKSFMQIMRKKFEDAGYKMPSLIYWNVRASKCGMFHETFDGENIAMVSGYSPSLFKSIIEGTTYEEVVNEDGTKTVREKVDPMTIMLKTLNNERYDRVVV